MFNKQLANEAFNQIHWKAQRDSLLAKVLRKSSTLKCFATVKNGQTLQKRLLNVMEIPTEKIVGTVERIDDFDGRFRPLKKHLRDRWVSVAIRADGAGWPPIEVFKVGEEYFVIDGHHRTSYALSHGMAFIDARVWEIQHAPEPEAQVVPAKPAPVVKPVAVPVCSIAKIEDAGAIVCGACA